MRQALASIVLALSLATSADAALACSCARNPTAETILAGAEAVFTGIAKESTIVAPGRSVTTFTVLEPFKGVAKGATLRVLHSSGSSASCGVKFCAGQTYTLAVHHGDAGAGLTTSLCSTWMFAPQVGLSAKLIQGMRAIRDAR